MIRELVTDMEVRKQRSSLRIINAPGWGGVGGWEREREGGKQNRSNN